MSAMDLAASVIAVHDSVGLEGHLAEALACAAVVVCATSPTAADVAAPLRAPGLLDHVLTLRAPAAEDRAALLASALQSKAVLFDHDALEVIVLYLSLPGQNFVNKPVLKDCRSCIAAPVCPSL